MARPSPNGAQLAFVADRGEGIRVYLMPIDGGEPRALTPTYSAIGSLAWSPDSRRLAFTATSQHDPVSARIAHDEPSGARHIRALPFKSDDEGLLDGRRKHLYVVDVDAAADPVQLTSGDFDVSMPAWSPDGSKLAFGAQIDAPETAFYSDIYLFEIVTRAQRKLTASNGPMSHPAFSHDGAEIAFLGHTNGDDGGGRFNIEVLIVAAAGSDVRSVSAAIDRSVTDFVICDVRGVGGTQAPIWSPDDRELFVPLSTEGTCGIAAFTRDGTAHRTVAAGPCDIVAFTRLADGTTAAVFSDPRTPSDLALITADGTVAQLTRENPWLEGRAIRAPRRLRPQAKDGTPLDLFILDPDEPANAPLVLQVHGGPHTAYGYAFFFEFQLLASHGIGVAYGNPRGSQTYGHAYADAITGDWGGIDAADVLTLLDGAEAAGTWDPERIGIAGGSYGGFMTTWLLGHSKRFAAGISMRAVNDFVSEVGASDIGWFLERELRAPWTDAGEKLFAGSPMRAAHDITAPLLVEHSERDYRCPIDQGEQLFSLLRRLGKTAEFVRFTGDGHNLSRTGKPRNRVLRLRAIAQWFIRHLRPAGIVVGEDVAGSLFAPLPTEQPAQPTARLHVAPEPGAAAAS